MVIDSTRISALLSVIYEAAIDPSAWPRALAEMQNDLEAIQSSFLLHDFNSNEHTVLAALPKLDASVQRDYETYYGQKCLWGRELLGKPTGWIGSGTQLVSDRKVLASEYYNDFLRKLDLRYIAVAQVQNENRSVAAISFLRSHSETDFDKLADQYLAILSPHMRRAIGISRRLGLLQNRATSLETLLNQSTTSILLLDSSASILFANIAAEKLLRASKELRIIDGKLQVSAPKLQNQLTQFVTMAAQTARGRGLTRESVLNIPRENFDNPLFLRVAPFVAEVPITGPRAEVLVFISDPDSRTSMPSQLLAELFALTPAEARLATLLASGQSLRECAEQLQVAHSTVRSQLLAIFQKTGTSRQSQLIQLLSNLSDPTKI